VFLIVFNHNLSFTYVARRNCHMMFATTYGGTIIYKICFQGCRRGVRHRSALADDDFCLPPKKLRVTRGASVDATLPLDKSLKWLGIILVRGRVPHNPRPLAPRSFVNSDRVGGAPDDGGERVFALGNVEKPRPQGPASPFDVAPFGGPPSHQVVDRGQVPVDRVPPAAALAYSPGVPNPVNILPQGPG
jgi:hypothetical protein